MSLCVLSYPDIGGVSVTDVAAPCAVLAVLTLALKVVDDLEDTVRTRGGALCSPTEPRFDPPAVAQAGLQVRRRHAFTVR